MMAVLLASPAGAAPAQPVATQCAKITTLLNGSGNAKGLSAQAQSHAQDAEELQSAQASLEAALARARKGLASSLTKNDRQLAATQQTIVKRLQNAIASNKKLLADSSTLATATRREEAALRSRAASLHCSTTATRGAPPISVTAPPLGPGAGAAGPSAGCRGFIGKWQIGLGRVLDINWAPFSNTEPQNINKLRGAVGGSATTRPDLLIEGSVSGNRLAGDFTTWSPSTHGRFAISLAADGRSFSGESVTSDGSSTAWTGTCLGPPGGTYVGAGTLDLSGNWTLHVQSGATYYDHDTLLSGPPGGPWRIAMTLRATNDSYWSSHLGYKDTDCTLFPLGNVLRGVGPNGSMVAGAPITSIVNVNGFRYDCQGVENGATYHRASDGALVSGKILGTGWELHR